MSEQAGSFEEAAARFGTALTGAGPQLAWIEGRPGPGRLQIARQLADAAGAPHGAEVLEVMLAERAPEEDDPSELAAELAGRAPVVVIFDAIDRDPPGQWIHRIDRLLIAAARASRPLAVILTGTAPRGVIADVATAWSPLVIKVETQAGDADVDVPAGVARDVLLTASLCGEVFPIHPVLEGLGLPWQGEEADDVIDAFDDAVVEGAGLALDTEGDHPFKPMVAYRFASAQIRAHAEAALHRDAGARAVVERAARIAQHLERTGVAGRDARAAATAAELWGVAGVEAQAEHYAAVKQWRHALAGDPGFTEELVERAGYHGETWRRAVVDRMLGVLRTLGPAQAVMVLNLATAAGELAGEGAAPTGQGQLGFASALALRAVGRVEDAVEAARAGRDALTAAEAHAEAAELNLLLASLLVQLSRHDDARACLDAAQETAVRSDKPSLAARAQLQLAAVELELGKAEEAAGRMVEVVRVLAAGGDTNAHAAALLQQVATQAATEDFAAATATAQEARAVSQRGGLRREVGVARLRLGQLAAVAGDLDGALAELSQTVAFASQAGDSASAILALTLRGAIMAHGGALAVADQQLREAVRAADVAGDDTSKALTRLELGRLLRRTKQPTAAFEELRAAQERARACGDVRIEAAALLEEGRALIVLGERDQAGAVRQRAEELAGTSPRAAAVMSLATAIEARRERSPDAPEQLEAARRLFAQRLDVAHVLAVNERLAEIRRKGDS